jgi:hypothetical protein
MAECANGAALPLSSSAPLVYPNPSNGIYNCEQNGELLTVNEIIVTNAQGARVGYFKNVRQFNISNTAAGVYWYRMLVNGVEYKGKLLKL